MKKNHFLEEKYLIYTNKTQFACDNYTITFLMKQGQTRASSEPIILPLKSHAMKHREEIA